MERITVRIAEQVKRELESEAREKGLRPSDIVREVLEAHLKARPRGTSCLDIARRIGLVGCVRGLPADLSANRAHFEDFGHG